MTETKPLSVPEKQMLLRKKRSMQSKLYRKYLRESGLTEAEFVKTLKPGAGKGKEPDPLCECHNRNPCPIDEELNRG